MPPFQTTRATGISPATSRPRGGNRVREPRLRLLERRTDGTGLLRSLHAGQGLWQGTQPLVQSALFGGLLPPPTALNGGCSPGATARVQGSHPTLGYPWACNGFYRNVQSQGGQHEFPSSVQSNSGCSFFSPQSGAGSSISSPERLSLCPRRRPVIQRDLPSHTF